MPPPLPPTGKTPPPLHDAASPADTPRESGSKIDSRTVRRWLLLALGLCFAAFCAQRLYWIYGIVKNHSVSATSQPGETEFHAANRSIIRFTGKAGLGNTPAAEGLATRYAKSLQLERELSFTEGNKDSFSISKHQFIAYCHISQNGCVFLVHVPELRRFTLDAKAALEERAWILAHELARDAHIPADARLVVGVKGFMNYDAVLFGKLGNEAEPLKDLKQQERGLEISVDNLFYPLFADSKPEPQLDYDESSSERPPFPISAPSNHAIGYLDYSGLWGEDFQGNVFVIQSYDRRWAVMSRHQFKEDSTPGTALDPDVDEPISLSPAAALRQRDVQIIPLADQAAPIAYLEFDPLFELEVGEKLWIGRGPTKQGTEGILLQTGLDHGRYSSLAGHANLSMQLDAPADVRGASGMPVIRIKTGKPVGVLLAADNGAAAQRIIFEPICMTGKQIDALPGDAEIAQRLIGIWKEDFWVKGVHSSSKNSLDANGRFACLFPGSFIETGEPLWVRGNWRVEDAKLVYFNITSNDSKYPIKVYEDKVVELGADYLIYSNQDLPGLSVLHKMADTQPTLSLP